MSIGSISEEIRVRFWGVRGSIPSPGPLTYRYGGNTSCVTIEGTNITDGKRRLGVFDAGTGIRQLGLALADDPVDIIFLLSHTHWDHIQGFPFFAPIYDEKRKIYFSRLEERAGLFQLLLEQMDGTRFPLSQEQLRAQMKTYTDLQVQHFGEAGYRVSRTRVNHPGETYGFRADLRGASVVYIPDNELDPPYDPIISFDELADFCRGADVLIHDSQYTEADMPHKRGWGHSVVSRVRELAAAAGVARLVLFHHDPDRSDDELDAIQLESEAWCAANAPNLRCTVGWEGLEVPITPRSSEDNVPLPPLPTAPSPGLRNVPVLAGVPDAA